MQSRRSAIAEHGDVAGPLLQHEGEVLGTHDPRVICIDGVRPHHGAGDLRGKGSFRRVVHDDGIEAPEADLCVCTVRGCDPLHDLDDAPLQGVPHVRFEPAGEAAYLA